MAVNRSGSIVAVDFGNIHTRAVLIDVVEGAYQLVAQSSTRTTSGFPSNNVAVGLQRVLKKLGDATGRRLLTQDGRLITPEQPDRSGVDTFVATASIGRPLRAVLVGLVPTVSIASGLRATAGTYVQVVETVSLDDDRDEEEQLNAIILSRPDLILITGGTEEGAREPVLQLARLARFAVSLITNRRKPSVLYAGNNALIPEIRALFDGQTTLFISPNVRPALDEEELEAAQVQLALAFNATALQRTAGFEQVGRMSQLGILPTAQSYNLIVDFLGQAEPGGVLAVDVGSATSTFAASYNGRVNTSIRTDIGLGHSSLSLLDAVGIEAIRDWIPFNVPRSTLITYLNNKSLQPNGVPETLYELYLEHALLRAGIQALAKASSSAWGGSITDGRRFQLPPFRQIIGAGAGITNTGRPGMAALLLLDALQPSGVTDLRMDGAGVIPALGALAHANPAAVVQVLEGGGLERLGTCFNISGQPRAGRTALRVKITPKGGAEVKQDIAGGSIWIYRLPPDTYATVEIRASGGLSIGGKGRLKLEVEGGLLGLVFDARGRPLPLAADIRARAAQMAEWYSQVTGDAVRPVDEAWFAPLPKDDDETAVVVLPDTKAKPKRQRGEKKPKQNRRSKKEEAAPEAEADEEIDELRNLLS